MSRSAQQKREFGPWPSPFYIPGHVPFFYRASFYTHATGAITGTGLLTMRFEKVIKMQDARSLTKNTIDLTSNSEPPLYSGLFDVSLDPKWPVVRAPVPTMKPTCPWRARRPTRRLEARKRGVLFHCVHNPVQSSVAFKSGGSWRSPKPLQERPSGKAYRTACMPTSGIMDVVFILAKIAEPRESLLAIVLEFWIISD